MFLAVYSYKKRETITAIKWKINDSEKGKPVTSKAGEEASVKMKHQKSSAPLLMSNVTFLSEDISASW